MFTLRPLWPRACRTVLWKSRFQFSVPQPTLPSISAHVSDFSHGYLTISTINSMTIPQSNRLGVQLLPGSVPDNPNSMGISFPFLSFLRLTLNPQSTRAILRNKERSAKCIPTVRFDFCLRYLDRYDVRHQNQNWIVDKDQGDLLLQLRRGSNQQNDLD